VGCERCTSHSMPPSTRPPALAGRRSAPMTAGAPSVPIRYLGGLGQSTDPGLPMYNANGLPLITNLIELVSTSSVASGRHAGLTPGKIAVLSWPGPPTNSVNQHSGVKWIHADTWIPYQRTNFVTPAFSRLLFRPQHFQPFRRGNPCRDDWFSFLPRRPRHLY